MGKYYGAFGAKRWNEALIQLIQEGLDRLKITPLPEGITTFKYPVAILFARGDRDGDGDQLAQQAVSSFYYWNDDSGSAIDFIYAGWHEESGELKFNRKDFLAFRSEFEGLCTWKYTGETDLLLMNFKLDPNTKSGYFAFEEVILLPIEEMLREKLIGSVDALVTQIIIVAKEYALNEGHESKNPIWVISDQLAIRRGKKDFWDSILRLVFRDYADKLKGIGHLAVRNIASPEGTWIIEFPT
jgi:hypothetical protein